MVKWMSGSTEKSLQKKTSLTWKMNHKGSDLEVCCLQI